MKYLVFMLLSAYPGAIGSVTLPADDSGISSDTEVSFATCTDVPPGAIGVDIFPEVAVVWFSEVLLSVTSTEAPCGATGDVVSPEVGSNIFSCGLVIGLVCPCTAFVVIVIVTKVMTAAKTAIIAFIIGTVMNNL
jgi:hypothetical protein